MQTLLYGAHIITQNEQDEIHKEGWILLEDDRIITRTVYPEVPPRVEYELTALGRSLEPILISMRNWGQAYSGSQAATDCAEPV